MAVWSVVQFSELVDLRLDSEYYQASFLKLEEVLKAINPISVDDFAFVTDGIHNPPERIEEGGVIYLQAKNVRDNYFSLSRITCISQEQHKLNPRTQVKVGDVLLTTTGTIGDAAVVDTEILPANTDRDLGIIRIGNQTDIDPYYLAAFLNSQFGRFQTIRESTGNVQLHLFISKIKNLLVPVGDRFNETGKLTRKAYDKRRESESLYAEAETLLLHELGLDTLDLSTQKTYVANFSETMEGDRFDAEYFHPEKRHIQEQLNAMPGEPIGYYFTSVNELLHPPAKDTKEKVYNYDLTHALRFFLNEDDVDLISTHELGSTKKRFQQNDIVISRLRSYLEEIAIVKTDSQFKCVGSSEFFIFRSISQLVSPELLLVYLRSSPIQKVLKWCQDGSNHPRFKDAELLELKFPNCLFNIQKEVQDLIHQGIGVHQEAKVLLEQAKHRVEQMIVGEHAADEYPS